MRRILIAVAVSASFVSTPSRAEEPLVLEASSAWALHNDGQRCKLVRTFGTDGQFVYLELRIFNPRSQFQLLAAGAPFKPSAKNKRRANDLRFLPSTVPFDAYTGYGKLADGTPLISSSIVIGEVVEGVTIEEVEAQEAERIARGETISLMGSGSEREKLITGLYIDGPYTRPVILNTGPMDQPMQIVRTCIGKLLVGFGVDMEAHQAYLRGPVPQGSPNRWFSGPDAFPKKMLQDGKIGSVSFRLLVDEKGDPTKCDVLDAGQGDVFSKSVCSTLMKKAGFDPALDAQGNPMPSVYTGTVNFVF